jgi:hypothetical protein
MVSATAELQSNKPTPAAAETIAATILLLRLLFDCRHAFMKHPLSQLGKERI